MIEIPGNFSAFKIQYPTPFYHKRVKESFMPSFSPVSLVVVKNE